MNKHLVSVVTTYKEEIVKDKNVFGIVLTGGAANDSFDKYSDVDLVIIINSKHSVIQEGKFHFENYLFDVRGCELKVLQQMDWSYDMYFAYLYSKIIYDPENHIQILIDKKERVWKKNISTYIVIALAELSVIFRFDDNWKGLKAETHYHKFCSRRDFLSAHRVLNAGFEIILDILYLLNDNPPPDFKNKVRMLKKMSLLPSKFIPSINEFLLINSLEHSEVERKYSILSEFINFIKDIVNLSNRHFPENFYQYYVNNRV